MWKVPNENGHPGFTKTPAKRAVEAKALTKLSHAKKAFHLARSQGIAYALTYASLTWPQCQLTRGDSSILLTRQLTLT